MRIAKPGLLGGLLGAGLGAAGGAIADGGKAAGKGALIGGLAGAALGGGYGAYKTNQECGTVFGDTFKGLTGCACPQAPRRLTGRHPVRDLPTLGAPRYGRGAPAVSSLRRPARPAYVARPRLRDMVGRDAIALERRRRRRARGRRPSRLRLSPGRRRDLARRVGRRQHLGQASSATTAGARCACCASRAAAPTSNRSSARTSPACAWTTSSPCSSARTWATRRWSPTSRTRCRIPAACGRPSRRCCTASSPRHAVVHTHADAVVSLTNNDRAAEVLAGVYGKDVIALDYRRPGFQHLARGGATPSPRIPRRARSCWSKHGTITWGATVRRPTRRPIELIRRAEEAIAERRRGRRVFGGPRVTRAGARGAAGASRSALAPRLRGHARPRRRRVVVTFDDSPAVTRVRRLGGGAGALQVGPPRPTTRSTPSGCRASCRSTSRRSGGDVAAARRARGRALRRRLHRLLRRPHIAPAPTLADPFPRVVLVPGLGMFTAGQDRRTAGIVNDIYHHTIAVLGNATAFGRYVSLSRAGTPSTSSTGRSSSTSSRWRRRRRSWRGASRSSPAAARGIGRAVAQRLAAEGAHVVVDRRRRGGRDARSPTR